MCWNLPDSCLNSQVFEDREKDWQCNQLTTQPTNQPTNQPTKQPTTTPCPRSHRDHFGMCFRKRRAWTGLLSSVGFGLLCDTALFSQGNFPSNNHKNGGVSVCRLWLLSVVQLCSTVQSRYSTVATTKRVGGKQSSRQSSEAHRRGAGPGYEQGQDATGRARGKSWIQLEVIGRQRNTCQQIKAVVILTHREGKRGRGRG